MAKTANYSTIIMSSSELLHELHGMINEDKKEPEVQPEDSVNQVSCSSTSRASSTAPTTSTHARARAAGLAAAAAAAETEQCLEREEQVLRQRRELLKL